MAKVKDVLKKKAGSSVHDALHVAEQNASHLKSLKIKMKFKE